MLLLGLLIEFADNIDIKLSQFVCHCLSFVSVDSLSAASTPGQDLAAAGKLESDADAEDDQGEEKRQELKSPNRRSNQVEAKEDDVSVSKQLVIFMLL